VFQLSSGHGLVIGPLKIVDASSVIDCSVNAVIINDFSHFSLVSPAQAVLVVEKDATFQKLIEDGFRSLFPNIILVTGRGYPDNATRILLHKLRDIPLFGLLDCDPHGIEIAMTYKYGGAKANYALEDRKLPHFQWVGLSRFNLPKFAISDLQFIPLQQREMAKVERLCQRAAALGDITFLTEVLLQKMYMDGNKLELEAVSGIAPGSMCRYLLQTELGKYAAR
ncbi:unnamed protein product, partial [Gongylonema pulchrum]|uniref:TP6A_N domain-containing protein n=1 Tax=Gongylonema pulchrum TaxID=637853 RepID=A0A183E693_9BILA